MILGIRGIEESSVHQDLDRLNDLLDRILDVATWDQLLASHIPPE
jgi:hypothetical protein